MERTGICQSCGKIAILKTCNVCGVGVCNNCILEFGCKICRGKIKLKK